MSNSENYRNHLNDLDTDAIMAEIDRWDIAEAAVTATEIRKTTLKHAPPDSATNASNINHIDHAALSACKSAPSVKAYPSNTATQEPIVIGLLPVSWTPRLGVS